MYTEKYHSKEVRLLSTTGDKAQMNVKRRGTDNEMFECVHSRLGKRYICICK